MHEATGLDGVVRFQLIEPLTCTVRQHGVGMEKEQPLAGGDYCAGIHLGSPTLRCLQHLDERKRTSNLNGPIAAPAVDNEHFVLALL